MSSEQLADGVNPLDAELAATWDILKGYSGRDTDLGIARRFGGAAAAYSLRDIGAMNGSVVRVRREPEDTTAAIDDEENFSANQVQDGTLERWVNGELESTLPADVATAAAAYSLRKVKASYSGDAVRIRRSSDDIEVDVAFDSDGKVSASSAITNVSEQGGEIGSTTATTLGEFITTDAAPNFSGNSLLFNGTNTNVGITAITLSGDFTFSFDAFLDFSESNGGRVAGRTSGNGWVVNFETDGSAITTRPDGVSGVAIIFDSTLSSGEHSFILTRSSGTITLSVDGVTQADTGTKTEDYTINFIGRNASQYFKGSLRNININGVASYNGYGNTDADWIDQIGSNNGTVNGTAEKFLGVSAFVHTWYDQAGSNNAVQETDVNQPKIAESGALLADGIDFDGSNDEMVLTSALGATTVQSIFAVQKNDITSGGSLLFDNRDANDDGSALFATDSAGNKQASWDATDAEHTATTNEELIGLIKTSSAITIRANGVQKSSTSSSSTIDISTVPKIGQGSFGSSGTNYDGSIKEIICYNSDQSANRFKIESNINNYYGLYNDANELSAAFDSNGTITGESKDGFTADVATFSHYVNATFNNSVATSETIYVSFNAQLAPNGGTAASPILRLQDAQVGSNTSNQSSISEGFNSIDLTATGTSDRVGFLEQDDNVDYIISDFKVSRIARNGFVETLYDQSGNGDDMTQATAGSQPAIVQNGGQVKLICGKPAFKGDGTDDFLEASYFYSAGEVTSLSGFTVCSNDSDTGQEEAIISAGYGLSTTYPGFTIQLDRNSNADPFEIRTANASGANETPLLSIAKDGDILGSTFFTKDDTQLVRATTKDGSSNTSEATSVGALHSNSTSGKLRIGAIRSFAVRQFFGFFISEAIVFKGSDLRDEGIENEINQFYNIG